MREKDIVTAKSEALSQLAAVASREQLEDWRRQYLARQGTVPLLLRQIKTLDTAERRRLGQAGNALRQELTQAYQAVWQRLLVAQPKKAGNERAGQAAGHLHPLTIVMRRIQQIFSELGFQYVEGPLAEDPRYNFDLLNIPPEHPARAETDAFYLTNGMVLRAHVSPMQIRGPKDQGITPPYKIFYLGRSFRAERTDATHETTFNQFEFMVVSKTATLAELKGVVEYFYAAFFEKKVEIRLRPAFFPFVEPGLEVDLKCVFCAGKGCRVCKHTGWIEMAGAGMVHPNVLRNSSIDPNEWQGYALGGAVDRLAMLKYDINDIRKFWTGDVKFISSAI